MNSLDLQILGQTAKRYFHNRREKRRTGLYPLDMLILYVTMRCNAKCDHCFCWEDLNIGIPEMSLEQIESLAGSVPPMRTLILTGGEPTLRADLPEVFSAFARHGKAETIMVNTNGLKPDLIESLARRMKSEHPGTGLDFQISIDGLEETHDRIRGVPGNFRKAISSLQRVFELAREFPALSAHVLTVITELNHRELVALNDHLREHVGPQIIHGFELVRDVETSAWGIPEEIREKGVGPKAMNMPPVEEFDRIAEDLKTIQRRSTPRVSSFHIHNLAQLEMVRTQREQYPCVTAGQAVGVIYSNGDVAHCEFTLPFANLGKFDFDFEKLWHSPAANERRGQIRSCFCTHGCFHGKAVEYSLKGLREMARASLPGLRSAK